MIINLLKSKTTMNRKTKHFPNGAPVEFLDDAELVAERSELRSWLKVYAPEVYTIHERQLELPIGTVEPLAQEQQVELVRRVSIRLVHIEDEIAMRIAETDEDEASISGGLSDD
jgi:hypothetical protein